MHKLIKAILPVLLPALLHAQAPGFMTGDFETVKARAIKENKLVFVDMMFEGCMPCKQMEVKVFPDPSVKPYLDEHFISYQSDIYKERTGKLLARKFGVTGAPHYLIFNARGVLVDAGSGFMGATHFLPWLQASVAAAKAGNVKKYRPGLEGAYPAFYSDFYLEKPRFAGADTVAAYLDTQQNLATEENYAIMNVYLSRLPEKYKEFYYQHMEQFARDYGRKSTSIAAYRMLSARAGAYGEKKEKAAFEQMMQYVQPLYSAKDWKTFGKIIATRYFEKSEDVGGYIRFAGAFEGYSLADKAMLAAELAPKVEGQALLLQQMDSWLAGIDAAADYQQAGLWYVKAVLQYYLGNKAEATNALAKVNTSGQYARNVAALKDALQHNTAFSPGKVFITQPLMAD
ncbi:thioredoxin fold domain-containing protein [Chitinophaga sp.]|uniref:thioredoxin family protein n=1 Tax=Chitinophaga sp. TaxID=1869181 RepID=UPI0031DD9C33